MNPIIIEAVAKYWKLAAALIMAAAIAILFTALKAEKGKVADRDEQIARMKADYSTLLASVNQQNKAVNDLKNLEAKRAADVQTALASVNNLVASGQSRITALMVDQRKPNETACDHARRLIDEDLASH